MQRQKQEEFGIRAPGEGYELAHTPAAQPAAVKREKENL